MWFSITLLFVVRVPSMIFNGFRKFFMTNDKHCVLTLSTSQLCCTDTGWEPRDVHTQQTIITKTQVIIAISLGNQKHRDA